MLKPSRGKFNADPTSPTLAKKCPLPENASACQLPHCFCSKNGHIPPGNIPPDDTPQLIVLTFDDPINERTFSQFRQLFHYLEKSPNSLFNKNGCPIKGTFFVNHEWTDYDLVEWLYVNGHEIASNSITYGHQQNFKNTPATHASLTNKSLKRWEAEMNGQRRILSNLSHISIDQITGMRAPQLALGGDTTFMIGTTVVHFSKRASVTQKNVHANNKPVSYVRPHGFCTG
uniref:NodB homology domain-containing protein n=1 Tax=Romanomermis culicivorax TaxID=13658 RepID=A0A915HFU0_ROMCU